MCINIWKQILCKYIFFSIANLKCTPSDRQMYPWGYMYPRLGTPDLEYRSLVLKNVKIVGI